MRIHVAFDPEHNALDKKGQKRAPKVFKSGAPGLSGKDRLLRRIAKIEIDLHKFAGKRATAPADSDWAIALAMVIREAK